MSKPTARQAEMLRRAASLHPHFNVIGFGPLGVDLRTYDALLRKGWISEVTVERKYIGGPGTLARITDDGRKALATVDDTRPARDDDYTPEAVDRDANA